MMERLDIPIGTVFYYGDVALKVVEENTSRFPPCTGCYFKGGFIECHKLPCICLGRHDRKNVKFEKITDKLWQNF